MKKTIIRIVIIFLVLLLAGVSVWLAIKLKDTRAKLDSERLLNVNLSQELLAAQEELDKTRIELDKVNIRLTESRRDNQKLLQEKAVLEARLHSLTELKEAIKQVKREIWRKNNQQGLTEGNFGFLMKDGKSTHKPVAKIEVRPDF
ncbi:MAG: hypothetical protein V1869_02955 [Candidatus Omnitrophota bacterium]